MSGKIPVTISILTRNSAGTLAQALESVKDFADILVCDGGSTDATLDIARQYGARVIAQDKKFLDADGRIVDYAGVRNECLDAARERWFFFLDSDEYASPELIDALEAASQGPAAAYHINRLHTVGGRIATCDISYPNRQVRFFSRDIARRFIKAVHERVDLNPGVTPRPLAGSLMVPWDHTPQELKKKWERYIELEVARFKPVNARTLWRVTLNNAKIMLLYALRLVRNAFFCRGVRIPPRVELMWFWYHAHYTQSLWSAWLHR